MDNPSRTKREGRRFGAARAVRLLMALLIAFGVAVTSSSCVNALDLDEYADATDELCDLLDRCFGTDYFPECHEHTGPRLTTADGAQREQWLSIFSDRRCLQSCNDARRCLDNSPVCGDVADGCGEQTEACCGFIAGKGDCKAGLCCKPDGVACPNGNGDCCNANCDEATGFCGGFQCLDPGATCTDDFECCTKNCTDEQRCAAEICSPNQAVCEENIDCCSGFCDTSDPSLSRCAEPACAPLGFGCDAATCCAGLECHVGTLGQGVCSLDACLPEGIPCTTDDVCCDDGVCDPTFGVCSSSCGEVGDSCTTNASCCGSSLCGTDGTCSCIQPGGSCSAQSDCCSGQCNADGVCAGDCQATSCHAVCEVGPPMNDSCLCPSCAGNSNLPDAVNTCVPTICAKFPECCCGSWSQTCVLAVLNECGTFCPTLP